MAEHMRTELVLDAVEHLATRESPARTGIAPAASRSRSSQRTSTEYRQKLGDLELRHSVGRTGQCWDNALAESFFATLKNERCSHPHGVSDKKESEGRYCTVDRTVLQSSTNSFWTGYRTPHEARTEYLNSQLAA